SRRFSNDARGLVSHTGKYRDIDISVTTSGMGGPSMGIVLPEAVQSGARIFIRVGSCGSLVRESKIGDVIIPTAAIRFDRTADDWAPPEYPALADWRVVSALHRAAQAKAPGGLPAGAINAVFANRHTNEWGIAGEELAAEIALEALVSLSEEASLAPYR